LFCFSVPFPFAHFSFRTTFLFLQGRWNFLGCERLRRTYRERPESRIHPAPAMVRLKAVPPSKWLNRVTAQ
jgi:hypothetical protein